MKKVSFFIVLVLALFSAACAPSSTVISESSTEGSAIASTESPEDAPDAFDPMATVAPTATVSAPEPTVEEAQPTSEPTPAPAAITSATFESPEESEPDPTPEPTPTPDVPVSEAFASAVAQANATFDKKTVVQIELERTMRQQRKFDFSLTADVILDEITPLQSVEITYTGADWRGSTSAYQQPPWQLTRPVPGDDWVDRFGKAVITDPGGLIADFEALLGLPAQPERTGDGFQLDVANADLLTVVPGSSLSPWTSSQAIADGVADVEVPGATTVAFTFRDGRLIKVELDYGALLRSARSSGARLGFGGAIFRETYRLVYEGVASPVPTPLPVLPPSEPNVAVGDCFMDDEYLKPDPVAVSCSESHTFEVVHVGSFDDAVDADYPGREALVARGTPICESDFETLTGVGPRNSVLAMNIVVESPDGWEVGERRLICLAVFDTPISLSLAQVDVQRIGDRVADSAIVIGDCFVTDVDVFDSSARVVDCAAPHRFQAYAVSTIPGLDEYPGPAVISAFANDFCKQALLPAIDEKEHDRDWLIDVVTPTEEGWTSFGDRLILCFLSLDELLDRSVIGG